MVGNGILLLSKRYVSMYTYILTNKGGERMTNSKKEFGNFLRDMIKQTGISQASFYAAVEITKPYFYDILSGKVNPPPPEIQYKMLDNLQINENQRKEFLNLAAKGRNEIPADIAKLITEHPKELDKIRVTLEMLFATKG